MFKTVQHQHVYYVYDNHLIEKVADSFDAQYWQNKNAIIGSAQGRGTTWFVQLDNIEGALRHYRRGGLFAKIIADSYFFTGYQKTRSVAEFYLLNHLLSEGVNVPKPIAARVQRHGLCYQADLLSEKIPNAVDLVDLLQKRALSQKEYQRIGEEVAKLHKAQVNHTDLNIHNILLDANGKVWIIDFDKCYQQSGESWKSANLQRLLRSFNKELNKRQIKWSVKDWAWLTKGYDAFK